MKTIDITMEQWREYVTVDGHAYRIEQPKTLHITDEGSHRVVDADGVTHRPPRFGSDYVIRWLPKAGEPAFIA